MKSHHQIMTGLYENVRNNLDTTKSCAQESLLQGGAIAQLEFGLGTNPRNVITAFEIWEQMK
jgi:hypothetical protein